ncbi:hypothetical protein DJ568_13710 [Mucilaginibacter hurinus]|uniref:Outer membrane protein beta-barrel domain-containing protein n=1 Tax=Mucilaginibacter hurinus TaxID=2201324 RepID=A0A367GNV2_9SPHI|nr:TonB-dependent receptor [Mucilaginibacter hurinus]RCH54341.1 hypothetical protein DJ568_13710 [Mucilaginibacter hurinus]
MKLLTRCLIAALFGLISSISNAQNTYTSIEGKVLTQFLFPAEAATVRLLNHPDSTLIASTISDKSGFFQFRNIKPGNYFIAVSKVGYKRFYTVKYQLSANNNVKATEIKLIPLTHQLKEVSIIAKKEFIEVRSDKTVLNVDRSIVAAGNSVLDVLKTAPGVRVTGDEVLFRGGQKALIAINGKTVQLSGDQLADMLKSYQSSMISQIELIANPSAKYDAAGGGVINIVLKKSRDQGLRINISESASIGERYKLNSTTNLNYRHKKLNLFGSYTYSESEIPRIWNTNRNILLNNLNTNYNVKYKGTTLMKSHSFNVGGDFSITPKQNIGVLLHGFVNKVGVDKDNATVISNNGTRDSSILTNSLINRNIDNLNYNINYRGVFGAYGQHTLTADADYSQYDRKSVENLQNNFFGSDDLPLRDPLLFRVNSPSNITVYSGNIDYTQLIKKHSVFDAGIKVSKVNSTNKIDFDSKQGSVLLPVKNLTDHFVYNEQINAAYVNLRRTFDKVTAIIGVRAEQTQANRKSLNPNRVADTTYFGIFPSVQVNYDVNDDHQLSFSYNRRITRPNYQDLNPFVGYIDRHTYSTGNPFLRPQYMSSFQVADIYLIKFKGALSYNVIKDFHTPVFRQNDTTLFTTRENIGTRHQIMAEVQAPFDIAKWWQISNFLEATYERYYYNIPGAKNRKAYDLIVRVNQTFTITPKLRAELNAFYETPTFFGIKDYREQYFINAGLGYTILRNQGNIKLAVSDIFNTQVDRYSSRFLNLDLRGREKPGTRFITATFTYRFGNTLLRNARKRSGGATEEQGRLSGSSAEN